MSALLIFRLVFERWTGLGQGGSGGNFDAVPDSRDLRASDTVSNIALNCPRLCSYRETIPSTLRIHIVILSRRFSAAICTFLAACCTAGKEDLEAGIFLLLLLFLNQGLGYSPFMTAERSRQLLRLLACLGRGGWFSSFRRWGFRIPSAADAARLCLLSNCAVA
jgi:hypothetical protein